MQYILAGCMTEDVFHVGKGIVLTLYCYVDKDYLISNVTFTASQFTLQHAC